MALQVNVLGELECLCDGEPVDISSGRQRALLATLATEANNPVSPNVLAETVWGEDQPENPLRSLQTLVSRLRRALECDDEGDRIERTPAGYRLRIAPDELDAARFETGIRAGSEIDSEAAVESLTRALELWRGQPYGEFADQWFAVQETNRLGELRAVGLERLADGHLSLGRPELAVDVLQAATDERPLRESTVSRLMRSLYRADRQTAALDAYQAYRTRLGEELGLEPSPTIRDLEAAILAHSLTSSDASRRPDGDQVTVTFLISEIADAARSWETDAEQMAVTLSQHHEVVRREIEQAGGEVFTAGGDGFSAAFHSPARAASAALAMRSAFDESRDLGAVGARVRIGIHTGAALTTGGTFTGQALSRAGRLTAAAHPGQTLVSAATTELLRNARFAAGDLTDLGPHRLRDMAHSERIHQLSPNGDRTRFPTLHSAERPGNIPVEPDRLIGRDQLITEIGVLADRCRLLSLVGPGGVGKTRAALAAAITTLGEHAIEGAWLCELGGSENGRDADESLLNAVGLRSRPGSAAPEIVSEAWARLTALLVLDNCEHLLDWASTTAGALLSECPRLTIVVTSREPLGIADEQIIEVPPLDQQASVDLFTERARRQRAGFDLLHRDAPKTIAEICRRLEGLPLAIELAAARVRSLPLNEILARFDDALEMSGATLSETIRWSYDIIADPERRLFEEVSVFSGGFTLDGLEDLVAQLGRDPDDTPEVVHSLVSKSLMMLDDTPVGARYHLLDVIRRFAADRLEERGAESTIAAHMQVFARRAARLRVVAPADRVMAAARLDSDLDNYRAALETAIAAGDAGAAIEIATVEDNRRFLLDRHLGWSERALAVPGAELQPRRTIAASLAAYHAIDQRNDRDAARHWLERGIDWMAENGAVPDPFLHGTASLLAFGAGDADEVVAQGLAQIDLARETGDIGSQSYGSGSLAVMSASLGATGVDPPALGADAVRLARELGDPLSLEYALGCLANVLHRVDPETAVDLRDEGMAIDAGHVAQLQHAGGRTLLAIDRGEDPSPFVRHALRHMQLERDLQSDIPVLVATAAWATREGHAEIAGAALGHLATVPRAPWLRMGVAAAWVEEIGAFVDTELAGDAGSAARVRGAGMTAVAIVREALAELATDLVDQPIH